MGEVLLHPACKQMTTEMRLALVDKLLSALDAAIAAIEGSAPFAGSAELNTLARMCRTTRDDLSDRKYFRASPACLDLLMTFMRQVYGFLELLQKHLSDRNALIRSIPAATSRDAKEGTGPC